MHVMKNITPHKTEHRFSGTQRYYHRAGSNHERTWDDWVGDVAPKRNGKKRLKIAGIVVAILAFVAILAGLVIELA